MRIIIEQEVLFPRSETLVMSQLGRTPNGELTDIREALNSQLGKNLIVGRTAIKQMKEHQSV